MRSARLPSDRLSVALLGLSALFHLGVGFWVARAGVRLLSEPPPAPSRLTSTSWLGDTFDVEAATPDGEASEQAPAASTDANETESAAASAAPSETAKAKPPEPNGDSATAEPSGSSPKAPSPTGGAAEADAASTEGEATRTTGQTFGARDLPPGVRDLPSAFTRAIPVAVSKDRFWQETALGDAGSFCVQLELGSEGRIVDSRLVVPPGAAVPVPFERLRGRVVALLGGGQFALPASAGRQKVQRLLVDIQLSSKPESPNAAPDEVVVLGHEPPSEAAPGRAYFTLGSGRHFEARVTLLEAR